MALVEQPRLTSGGDEGSAADASSAERRARGRKARICVRTENKKRPID